MRREQLLILAALVCVFAGCAAYQQIRIEKIQEEFDIVSPVEYVQVFELAIAGTEIDEFGRYYFDRDYYIVSVPDALIGAYMVKTMNNDKLSEDDTFLIFTAWKVVDIFIGYDSRADSIPSWLHEFESIDEVLQVSDDGTNYFNLYKKRFEPGLHSLGGNFGVQTGAGSMYTMFLKEVAAVEDTAAQYYRLEGYSRTMEIEWTKSPEPDVAFYRVDFRNSRSGVIWSDWTMLGTYPATVSELVLTWDSRVYFGYNEFKVSAIDSSSNASEFGTQINTFWWGDTTGLDVVPPTIPRLKVNPPPMNLKGK